METLRASSQQGTVAAPATNKNIETKLGQTTTWLVWKASQSQDNVMFIS